MRLEGQHADGDERADERGGLLDAVVGDERERELELGGVGEAARDEIAGGAALHERERQHLQLAEIVEADGLQDAHARELREVAVEVAADRPEEKDDRDAGGDQRHHAERQGRIGRREDFRENVADEERHAGAARGTVDDATHDRRHDGAAHGPEVFEIRAETAHETRKAGGNRGGTEVRKRGCDGKGVLA